MRRRTLATAVGIAGLLLAGCGGDDGGDEGGTTTGDGSEETEATGDPGAATPDGDATGDAATGDGDGLCPALGEFLAEYQETLTAASTGTPPGSLDELSGLGQRARDAAPPEVTDSVDLVTETFEEMVTGLSTGNMDPNLVADPDALAAAVDDITRFGRDNCALDVGDYMDGAPPLGPPG